MKRRTTIAIVVMFAAFTTAVAQDQVEFNSSWSIHELAASESVPVKSLARELEINLDEDADVSLSSLGISRVDATDAIERYRTAEPEMVGSIVAVGMAIVFVSLVVVAFLISLFQHLHLFGGGQSGRKPRSVKSVVGTITSEGDLGETSIAAVVAAVFLHEEQVDAENRLLLTWKRASGNPRRTSETMPNASYFASRRSRR